VSRAVDKKQDDISWGKIVPDRQSDGRDETVPMPRVLARGSSVSVVISAALRSAVTLS
jgi:hypothetical protein